MAGPPSWGCWPRPRRLRCALSMSTGPGSPRRTGRRPGSPTRSRTSHQTRTRGTRSWKRGGGLRCGRWRSATRPKRCGRCPAASWRPTSRSASAGFKAVDKPWGTKYFYDSPILAKTLTWLRDLSIVKGFSTNGEQVGRLGPSPLFAAGKIAMAPQGSWMLSTYRDNAKFAWGVAHFGNFQQKRSIKPKIGNCIFFCSLP